MNPETKISSDGLLQVDFISWAEPQNGRMLWQVDVRHQGENINQKIFGGDLNYINLKINKWELEDEQERFYFIPVEGISKLIVKANFEVISLLYKAGSTVRFRGNKFQFGHLIQIWSDEIVLTNLESFKSIKLKWKKEGYIIWAEMINTNEIKVDSCIVQNGKREMHTNVMGLDFLR